MEAAPNVPGQAPLMLVPGFTYGPAMITGLSANNGAEQDDKAVTAVTPGPLMVRFLTMVVFPGTVAGDQLPSGTSVDGVEERQPWASARSDAESSENVSRTWRAESLFMILDYWPLRK